MAGNPNDPNSHVGEWVRVQFTKAGGDGGQVGLLMYIGPEGVMLEVNSESLSEIVDVSRFHFYPWGVVEFVEFEGTWTMPGKGKVGKRAEPNP